MNRFFYFIIFLLPVSGFAQEREKEIKEVVFQKRAKQKTNDVANVQLSAKQAKEVATISGGIEGLLKTLPSVNSNAELSSQYMVRGGNYDENLIYINDIEIYRPYLVRNSLQEGLSIINPDMVSTVNFSAGGFEAKYGDKMSSALNVYYGLPEKPELTGELSLIGGRLSAGYADRKQRFSGIISARYRNTNLVLNTLNEETDFNPQYQDLQSFFNYRVSPKLQLSFIGIVTDNRFEMLPKQKEVDLGTLLQPLKLSVFYSGRENDAYRNAMGNFSANFKPSKKWNLTADTFLYQNREKEYYTIASGYMMQNFDAETGDPIASYDAGGQIDHARNDLFVRTAGTQLRSKFSPNVNTDFEFGVKWENENITDNTNEWQLIDSLGYNLPRAAGMPGIPDDSALKLRYDFAGENDINTQRLSAFGQYSGKFLWNRNRIFVNAGIRAQHWSFNDETLVSPRAQFAIKPDWNTDMLFKLSGGLYYQAPFYNEIKSLDGSLDPTIKAQRSIQVILGHDYEFEWKQRTFKLTSETYYKRMDRLIPYYMDNVRIRYAGQNNAEGYAYGMETRLFGEFVPGVDSWISAGYSRIFENIEGRGFVPRPTDQRMRLAMFYQDYMPAFPSMRANLTLVYAQGLPTGTPISVDSFGKPLFDAQYRHTGTLPAYKRVDIGLSKIFIDQKENKAYGTFWSGFKELALGVQIFNALNIRNTVSNQWIYDVNAGYSYPVPVRLTGRFFNVKLDFKF